MQSSDGKIHFSCNECGTKFVATTEQAGKSGECKNCGSPIAVPTPKATQTKRTETSDSPKKRYGLVAFVLALIIIGWVIGAFFGKDIEPNKSTKSEKSATERKSSTKSSSRSSVQGFDDYRVNVRKSGKLTVCQVTFNSLPPTSDIAAEVVRNAVEILVKKDGSREILAMAFNASGDALPRRQYGGALTYKPSDGQILTMDERSGLQATEGGEGTYYVRVEDSRTARGITPVRKWSNVSVVFPNEPSGTEVKAAVLKEMEKLKPRGLDLNIYIYTGDKSNKITWKQIIAPNGNFMVVDYVAMTGEISPNWSWD